MSFALVGLLVVVLASAAAAQPSSESDYQRLVCAGMELEVTLPNGGARSTTYPTNRTSRPYAGAWGC